jgi:predicted lipid-binding transport protein (Tim44 family)
MTGFRSRVWLVVLALLAVFALTVASADAASRFGGGRSFGSRGARTAMPPAATRITPAPRPSLSPAATQPGAAGAFFRRPGFLSGLAGGLLGAGLFGLLFGHGLFGGMGGLASMLGLLIQIGIIVVVARLLLRWWQNRARPAYAGPNGAAASPRPAAMSGFGSAPPEEPVELAPADYDTFERLLNEVQSAYSREDITALRAALTPEMLSEINSDLAANASRGVVADLSGVKLLQGDLAEAWREDDIDYATVAMRYEIVDKLVDRATRRIVEGGDTPIEVTELWTFMRARGGTWLLSAIQQPEG